MKILFTFCILFLALNANAQESLVGTWNTGKENTRIAITKENDSYQGKIVSSDNPQAKAGTQLLKDIKSVGGEWKGKMFIPKKKKWYNATFKEKGNELLITVKAGFMSKSVAWIKE